LNVEFGEGFDERISASLADRYRIEKELGRGGMAVVFLAHDLKHDRSVALKVMRPELAASIGTERFLREIQIAAKLNHPHILAVHDSGESEGFLYYVMPHVEGESLRERMNREGPLPIEESLRIAREVAAALSYAHSLDIIHRDIKPENILLHHGEAMVADFGIARAVTAAGGERLTETGVSIGTPAYMSPEQGAGSGKVDGRSDIYALACVLYEMLAGEPPFTGPSTQAILARHALDPVPAIKTLRSTVPDYIDEAVCQALAKVPADRPGTGTEFAEALTPEQLVARVGKRRWPRRVAAAAAAVVVLVGAWALFLRGGGPAYERLAVLPPANLMNDSAQAYFIAGVHNELIAELQEAGVTVIARTSVMQYENKQTPIREIAQELDVDALIEASVMRAGDSVEIAVNVVDGRTQEYVADRIVRRSDLSDIERLYRGLTAAIAAEIQAALTPQAEAHLARARPVNPQAYEAYLKGHFHWQRMTPTDLPRALEYFQQARSLDSTYAPAHAGIALSWWFGASTRHSPRRAQARAAIHRALALDSTLAEVQYVAAMVRAWLDWDWEGAEVAFRKAIEINPSYAEARAFYANFLYIMERPEEGRAQMERALELDPFNPTIRAYNGGRLVVYERRYAEAIEELEAVLRIEPNHIAARTYLTGAYSASGNYVEALAMGRRGDSGDQELLDAVDRWYAEGGYRVAMLRLAETLAARPDVHHVGVAMTYAAAGERERTLDWLELAYEARHYMLPSFLPASGNPPVPGDDPRYQALRRRMGLPD
jgi:serine/threonine-protein kinase